MHLPNGMKLKRNQLMKGNAFIRARIYARSYKPQKIRGLIWKYANDDAWEQYELVRAWSFSCSCEYRKLGRFSLGPISTCPP